MHASDTLFPHTTICLWKKTASIHYSALELLCCKYSILLNARFSEHTHAVHCSEKVLYREVVGLQYVLAISPPLTLDQMASSSYWRGLYHILVFLKICEYNAHFLFISLDVQTDIAFGTNFR